VALGLIWSSVDADPPHWSSTSIVINCEDQCHTTHQAAGGQLTAAAGNVALCWSCHTPGGHAADLPISESTKALPGTSGTSHAFDVAAVNATLGTQRPLDKERDLRVMDGNLVCSSCHNQHRAEASYGGRSRVGATVEVVTNAGAGTVSSGGTYAGSVGVWYLVEIAEQGSETTARFRYSKDRGVSWFPTGCELAPGDTAPCLTADGATPIDFDSGNGATLTFSGVAADDFRVGARWEFSASWPMLRRDMPLNLAPDALIDSGDNATGDNFCRDCHRSWVMTHTAVETWDGTYRSHPVGVALNANAQGYDRGVPLDGSGGDQGGAAADSNPTNDLVFDASGYVQCLSCHGVHYADSNTQTVDGP
jgi:hypothetical protein